MQQPTLIRQGRFYLLTTAAFFLLYSVAESFAYPDTIVPRIINSIFLVSYVAALNWLLWELALPLLRKSWQKMLAGIFLLLLLAVLFSFGLYAWRAAWIHLHVYTDLTPGVSYQQGVLLHARFGLASIIFFGLARHLYQYNQLRLSEKQLRIEKQEAELNYLKSQTNPHFLFNTLNNIYVLARDKHEKTSESILSLSKILRFMLYETGGEFITAGQEVKIIEDYIALEKLRYDDTLLVKFRYRQEDLQQYIPPLLLMPLVENAFKYGVAETRNNPYVLIDLSVQDQQLVFSVKNAVEQGAPEPVKENIGLSNLRRQLELQYRSYSLVTTCDATEFRALLTINLASHA